jgi:hypothetical protein
MGISAEMGKLCQFGLEMRRNRHIGGRFGPIEKLSAAPRKRAPRERVRGIEPPPKAWEAFILPLNYTRASRSGISSLGRVWKDRKQVTSVETRQVDS